MTSSECTLLPGKCSRESCLKCGRTRNSNAADSICIHEVGNTNQSVCTNSGGTFDNTTKPGESVCHKPSSNNKCDGTGFEFVTCADLPFSDCSKSSSSTVSRILKCEQDANAKCTDATSCTNAGQCWGGVPKTYYYDDGSGWGSHYESHVCVLEMQEGQGGKDCNAYKICTGNGWCWDDKVRSLWSSSKCVVLHNNTESKCNMVGGTWTSTSVTESECLADKMCLTKRGWISKYSLYNIPFYKTV